MDAKPMTKLEMAQRYGVDKRTLNKWLKEYPVTAHLAHHRLLLTVRQVSDILAVLGPFPENA